MSGRLGTVPGGSPSALVAGGVEAETLQALENVESVLAAAGLAREHVLKCTVFLADMADFAAMNGVYAAFFEGLEPPARSTVGVNGLALGARVEIECVAAYPPGR
jgi:reactive intermediate/imine deaminase